MTKEVAPVQVIHRSKNKTLTKIQWRWLKRGQAIEPTIGHLKQDHRMGLPLLHPPGNSTDGTLAQHYDANLKRSADIVGEIFQTVSHSGLAVRVVIFSDHPLRQQARCKGYSAFFTGSCVPISRLVDGEIPLMVAGATVPNLAEFTSNLKVFSLASRWARR